jgi:methylenetetrahydrofolate dehydrogenase (NADP+)/methenyltetrahydrofolate cyclohydrolase
MQLLDGKVVSEHIKAQIKQEVDAILAKGLRAPHLVAILVGDNPASKAYVGSKPM